MSDSSRPLTWAYLLAAAADIACLQLAPDARHLTKPLLMPLLLAGYLVSVKPVDTGNRTVAAALLLSWAGDLLLLGKGQGAFMAGLVAFLLAHLAYIRYFLAIPGTRTSYLKSRPVMLLAVAVFVFELLYVLWPGLGPLRAAVTVYASVIGIMLCCALWQYGKLSDAAALPFMAGALLFVLSDALLAVARFRTDFPGSGIAVMATYVIAQLLIVSGSIRETRDRRTAVE
jgi:uncharacterized membrane protein YhhN